MRIRFFNTFEPVNTFYRDLLPCLAENGASVEVLVSRATYRDARSPLDESLRHPRIRIRYMPVGAFPFGGGAYKAWVQLTYTLGAAVRTLLGPRRDLNFFLTQPPLFQVWGYVLKLVRRQPYCILVMDLYPDVAVRAGVLRDSGYSTRVLRAMSVLAMKRADKVIVIGRCMQEHLGHLGVPQDRVRVVTNWANAAEVFPVLPDDNPLRREFGLEGRFVVLYSGNMGTCHSFDEILETARRLRSVREIRFVFVGSGSRRKEVEAAKQRDGLENLVLLPFQPADRLAHALSLGSVHFVSLRPGFEGLVVPSKTYGALAAGRPVIYVGSPRGEIARLIEEEGIGTVLPPGDPDALEKAVLAYFRDPGMLADQGRRAQELTRGRASRESALAEYRGLLNEIGSSPEV